MLWEQWKRTTRFINSARIALEREKGLWAGLEINDRESIELRRSVGNGGEYNVSLNAHIAAIADVHIFCSMTLMYSYSIAERAVADKMKKDTRELEQIESWATSLLADAGRDWDTVQGGKHGVVEVAVIRNALAHGARTFEANHYNRVHNAGAAPAWKSGDSIELTFESLKDYRLRLKSLLRQGRVEELTSEQWKEFISA